MKYSVSAVEDGIIRLEAENADDLLIKISELSFKVREGDVIFFDGENYFPEIEGTESRRADVFAKYEKIFAKNKK